MPAQAIILLTMKTCMEIVANNRTHKFTDSSANVRANPMVSNHHSMNFTKPPSKFNSHNFGIEIQWSPQLVYWIQKKKILVLHCWTIFSEFPIFVNRIQNKLKNCFASVWEVKYRRIALWFVILVKLIVFGYFTKVSLEYLYINFRR